MSNELTVNASLAYDDTIEEQSLDVVDRAISPSVLLPHRFTQSIGTTEEAIQLGELTTLGMCMFKNMDPTNYVELRVATSGAIFAKLHPDTNQDGTGGVALLYMGSGAQAPFAIANSAACKIACFLNPQ